jgi:hypothetical protein
MRRLHDQGVSLIHQDSFYRPLTPEQIRDVKGARRNAAAWRVPAHPRLRSPCTWHVLQWLGAHCSVLRVLLPHAGYNFDHPDAFDHDALLQCLHDLKVCVCVCVCVLGVWLCPGARAVPTTGALVYAAAAGWSEVADLRGPGCAVLCCAVLCCAVLCCAVLCCAVLCCQRASHARRQAGRSVEVPIYDFTKHARSSERRKARAVAG